MRSLCVLLALSAIAAIGCDGGDPVDPDEKPAVAFEGQPDPKFTGTWKTPDGNSTYDLTPDGKYHLEAKVRIQTGSFDTKSDGEWKLSKDRLLFRDASGNVVPYIYKLEGKKLTLTLTGSMKRETVLLKQ